jgi:hypothetical protein
MKRRPRMDSRKNKCGVECGVEPCPYCHQVPRGFDYIDKGLGVTIGCVTIGCDYEFVVKARSLAEALTIWNMQARSVKGGKK